MDGFIATLCGLFIGAMACVVEAWGFMILIGMTHIHLLEMVQPISYVVAFQFVLITIPVQLVGLALSAMGNS
jgi:hypothetical protein